MRRRYTAGRSFQEKIMQEQHYGFGCTLAGPIDEAVRKTTEALKSEGFGVLTTIDVQATIKTKLGVDRKPYIILGACNPHLAHRALQAEPELGLLLPCNVIVYEDETGASRVSIIDPKQMMGMVQNDQLAAVAAEAEERLRRVAEKLNG
jgi:uncharacterized protein (DUF302 family)